MNGFQHHIGVSFEIFAELGHENVHAPAEEIVILTPYIEQYFLPFEDMVGVLAQELEQVGLFLGEGEAFARGIQSEVGVREAELADEVLQYIIGREFAGCGA